MLTERIVVLNPSGLHARPASNFVKAAGHFKSDINVKKKGTIYNGKSMLSILAACIKCQDEIELQIDGPDEEEALKTLTMAIKEGLGEKIEA